MTNKILFYCKLLYKLLKKEVVNSKDYKREYDKVSDTYDYWLKEMGKYTDNIINSMYIDNQKELNILDFACALSYFDYNELFKLFNRVLKPEGMLAIITNVEGTLDKIEKIFLKVMSEKQEEVIKLMDIKMNLPKGKKGLVKWCNEHDLKVLEVKEGEVFFHFKEPSELLDWLNITGAAAGTRKIFRNYNEARPLIIEKIKKEKYKNGTYEINHKFAYGIFRKE